MEGRYEFDAADVLPLLEEARAATVREMTEAQRLVAAGVDLNAEEADFDDEELEDVVDEVPPGLWLMNDRGVYLRSNAASRPGDRVAYARGYRTGAAVGGEPTCEFIDAGQLAPLRPGDTLVVTVGERTLRLSLVRP